MPPHWSPKPNQLIGIYGIHVASGWYICSYFIPNKNCFQRSDLRMTSRTTLTLKDRTVRSTSTGIHRRDLLEWHGLRSVEGPGKQIAMVDLDWRCWVPVEWQNIWRIPKYFYVFNTGMDGYGWVNQKNIQASFSLWRSSLILLQFSSPSCRDNHWPARPEAKVWMFRSEPTERPWRPPELEPWRVSGRWGYRSGVVRLPSVASKTRMCSENMGRSWSPQFEILVRFGKQTNKHTQILLGMEGLPSRILGQCRVKTKQICWRHVVFRRFLLLNKGSPVLLELNPWTTWGVSVPKILVGWDLLVTVIREDDMLWPRV